MLVFADISAQEIVMVESSLLLSKREAAQMLGVSVRTLENLIAFRELPVRRVGRRRLIERQALEKFARRDHATKAQPKMGHQGQAIWQQNSLSKSHSTGEPKRNEKVNVNESDSPQHLPQQ